MSPDIFPASHYGPALDPGVPDVPDNCSDKIGAQLIVMATVNDKRPVNLDLTTIKFPLSALTSIAHRISGIALFVALPILLWLLDRSLASPESFAEMKTLLATPLAKLVVWGILAALLYHLTAGIKHLIMDMGIGETLEGGRRGAFTVVVVSIVLILLAGVWVW